MSSTKRTKHINVRYYFIKSRIDAGEVAVQWYSGEKMIGDFFSKPLSGSKFLRFRSKIMNCADSHSDTSVPQSKDPADDKSKTNELAMVSVGVNKMMRPGYWSKRPGQKSKFVSRPARHPARRGPTKNRTGRKKDSGKRMQHMAKKREDYSLDEFCNDMNHMSLKSVKKGNSIRRNKKTGKSSKKYKNLGPMQHVPTKKPGQTIIRPANKDYQDEGFRKMMSRPRPMHPSRPTYPYKIRVQFDHSDNFVKMPAIGKNQSIGWDCVVNRKTFDAWTGQLIEDLDINSEIPDEVLLRKLPQGVTYIKTLFEYGGRPANTGTNEKN